MDMVKVVKAFVCQYILLSFLQVFCELFTDDEPTGLCGRAQSVRVMVREMHSFCFFRPSAVAITAETGSEVFHFKITPAKH
jgi:hypothetical protein